MFPFVAFALAGIAVFLSKKVLKAPLPNRQWKLFFSPDAEDLEEETVFRIEGIYKILTGNDFAGEHAVVKCIAVPQNAANKFFISVYFEKDAGYFICEVKKLRGRILLNGYWTKQQTSETGKARFIINKENGGRHLLTQQPLRNKRLNIKGRIGTGNDFPGKKISLQFERPLPAANNFQIIAHRGGGRNADYYPSSENSVELIRLGALLGATGVEIDIQLTADNIPVLFHDGILSYRSMDDYYLLKSVSSYSLNELKELKLKKGEIIPTLKEALDVILYQTFLEVVWLDIKYTGDLRPVVQLQKDYIARAKELNRKLEIFIGIPDEKIKQCFKELPDYINVPSLTELPENTVAELNVNVWAPRWTDKADNEQIISTQQSGVRVYTWTVDSPELLEKFLTQYNYDGIATNVPSLLAYYHYIR